MKEMFKNVLNKKVHLNTTILTDQGSRREEGLLEVRDLPAWYKTVLSNNTKVIGRKIKSAFKPKQPIKFNPTIHLEVARGDVVFFNDSRWVVWATVNRPHYKCLIAQTRVNHDTHEAEVIHKEVILTLENSAIVDKEYMTKFEYEDLMSDKHEKIVKAFEKE